MDPVTIVSLIGTCASLASNAATVISGINDLHTRYKAVKINSNALVAQTRAVQAAARGIRTWIESSGSGLNDEERNNLRDSLEACAAIIAAMFVGVKEVLLERSRGSLEWKFWDRVKFLWDQTQMDQYAVNLNHQVVALSLYLHVLHLPNSFARRERLRRPESRDIIRNGIAAASSMESLYSGSPASSTVSRSLVNELDIHDPSLNVLTAENLAFVDTMEKNYDSPISSHGGDAPKNIGLSADGGTLKQPRPRSSRVSIQIRTSLDDIRSVISDSMAGRSTKKDIKLSLEQLTDLMTRMSEMLEDPGNYSFPDISDMNKEANALFTNLVDVLRALDQKLVPAIFRAIENENAAHLVRLLEDGEDLQALNDAGQTALHFAILKGMVDMMEILIRCGASTEALDRDGKTALHVAISKGRIDMMEILIQSGASIEALDRDGKTAIHVAVSEGKLSAVEMLLRHEPNLETLDLHGKTVIHSIDFENALPDSPNVVNMLECLLRAGANPEAQFGTGTLLHRAVQHGQSVVVDLLLSQGVNVETRCSVDWRTALHVASGPSRIDFAATPIIRRLLDAGVDPYAKNDCGETALIISCHSLIDSENHLKGLQIKEGFEMSSLIRPCTWYRWHIDMVLALLDGMDSTQESLDVLDDFRQSFLVRDIWDWNNLSRDTFKSALQAQRTFVLLEPDEVVFEAIRKFHEGNVHVESDAETSE